MNKQIKISPWDLFIFIVGVMTLGEDVSGQTGWGWPSTAALSPARSGLSEVRLARRHKTIQWMWTDSQFIKQQALLAGIKASLTLLNGARVFFLWAISPFPPLWLHRVLQPQRVYLYCAGGHWNTETSLLVGSWTCWMLKNVNFFFLFSFRNECSIYLFIYLVTLSPA